MNVTPKLMGYLLRKDAALLQAQLGAPPGSLKVFSKVGYRTALKLSKNVLNLLDQRGEKRIEDLYRDHADTTRNQADQFTSLKTYLKKYPSSRGQAYTRALLHSIERKNTELDLMKELQGRVCQEFADLITLDDLRDHLLYWKQAGRQGDLADNASYEPHPSFSQDGSRVSFGRAREEKVYTFNADTGDEMETYHLGRDINEWGKVTATSYLPDGKLVAASWYNKTVPDRLDRALLFVVEDSNKQFRELDVQVTSPVTHFAFSSDGKKGAISTEDSILWFDPERLSLNRIDASEFDNSIKLDSQTRHQPEKALSMAFSPDADEFVWGSNQSHLRFYNVKTGNLRHTVQVKEGWPINFLVYTAQRLLAVMSHNLAFLHPTTGELLLQEVIGNIAIHSLVLGPNGTLNQAKLAHGNQQTGKFAVTRLKPKEG